MISQNSQGKRTAARDLHAAEHVVLGFEQVEPRQRQLREIGFFRLHVAELWRPSSHSRRNRGQVVSASPMKMTSARASSCFRLDGRHWAADNREQPLARAPQGSGQASTLMLMPVRQTRSARAKRSKSISSTFSSTTVTLWCSGPARPAAEGRQQEGWLAFQAAPYTVPSPEGDVETGIDNDDIALWSLSC